MLYDVVIVHGLINICVLERGDNAVVSPLVILHLIKQLLSFNCKCQ